jgi:cytosine deaminase
MTAGEHLLRGPRLVDGTIVDVRIRGAQVTSVLPAGRAVADAEVTEIDLTGYMLLTAPAEPHAHLDKAFSWDAIRPPMGDLRTAVTAWREYISSIDGREIHRRARRAALAALANGTTAIRTHADIPIEGDPALTVAALAAVREELREVMDIEIVALAGPDVATWRIEAALDAGATLVGGAPHLSDDEVGDLVRLLSIAEQRGVGVDLHIDEDLRDGRTLIEFARRTQGWTVTRTAGHCVRLATLAPADRDEVIDAVVASGIAIIANPITNLWLQGWSEPVATPRGIAPIARVRQAGGLVAAGADNVRDPFNPLGRSDAMETAMLLVVAAHLDIESAWHAVSDGARQVMALPTAGPVAGARADLLAIRGDSLADAVAAAPADRVVFSRGRIVARSHTTQEFMLESARAPQTLAAGKGRL